MGIKIDVLKAYEGDCFFISVEKNKDKFTILVDGGTEDTYDESLKEKIEQIIKSDDKYIDLLIITHIDDDHIGGIKKLFEDGSVDKEIIKNKIKRIWYNSAEVISNYIEGSTTVDISDRSVKLNSSSLKISRGSAKTLEKTIKEMGIELEIIKSMNVYEDLFPGMKITILSPNHKKLEKINKEWIKEREWISSKSSDYKKTIDEIIKCDKNICNDSSNSNGASIGFLLEFNDEGKESKALFLGDAHNSVIIESLEELKKLRNYRVGDKFKVDIVKLSHHASNSNTSNRLIEMIDCQKYIISSNGNINNLPGKKCLSRIINKNSVSPIFYFNYDIVKEIFGENISEEMEKHKFNCVVIKDFLEV